MLLSFSRPRRSRLPIPHLLPSCRRLTCQKKFFEAQRQVESSFEKTGVSIDSTPGGRQCQNEINASPKHRAKRKPSRSQIAEHSRVFRIRCHLSFKLGDGGFAAAFEGLEENQTRQPTRKEPSRRIKEFFLGVRDPAIALRTVIGPTIGKIVKVAQTPFQGSCPIKKICESPIGVVMQPCP